MCGNEQVGIFTPKNVQFENVSFFIKVSDEEKFLLFQRHLCKLRIFKKKILLLPDLKIW